MWTMYAARSSQRMFYLFSGTSTPSTLLSSLLVRGKTSAAARHAGWAEEDSIGGGGGWEKGEGEN